MDKPRHPHVVRTWAVERTRQPVRNVPGTRFEDARKGPLHGIPQTSKAPKKPDVHPPEPDK